MQWDESPDGGFTSAFNQQNIPIVYRDDVGPGAFAGQLVTWKSEYLGQYQTSVTCTLKILKFHTVRSAKRNVRERIHLLHRRSPW